MAASVVVFCMRESTHFQRVLPLIRELSGHGVVAHVFAHESFRAGVERAGGILFDMIGKYPLEAADSASIPMPCRNVSYAAYYAEQIAAEVRAVGARLVVHDGFAVIGRVVAKLLELPYVTVCSGHNVDPARFIPMLEADPRVAVSPSCERAVRTLRERYGFREASPFWYVSTRSPFLNLYCEPEAYLDALERSAFEPVAFFGSLPGPLGLAERDALRTPCFGDDRSGLRVYVSFGTIVWRYYTREALNILHEISGALAESPGTHGLMSLGGARLDGAIVSALGRQNVRVVEYLDQWSALGEADVFITHQGLNSTHEAIFHRVPMISCPFFWDQPGLAKKCREFGIAVSLSESPRGMVDKASVKRAIDEITTTRTSIAAALERARDWEMQTIAARSEVVRSVLQLMVP